MRAKGSRDYRGRVVSRPCAYANKYTTKVWRIADNGIPERKEFAYGNRHFWARGYYVDTVGRNKKQIQEYIKHQLDEDQIADQMSLKEYIDPFTGSENKKA